MKCKMKIKYRGAWLFVTGVLLLTAVFVALAVSFIRQDHNLGLVIGCMLVEALLLVALYFRFNYGLTINEKHLVAIEQAGIKILRYDDISSITVKFTNESVTAYIKMKKQQEYVFVWDSIFLGLGNLVIPSSAAIKLCDEFVQRSIVSLEACPKVKIQNFYTAGQ